MWGERGLKERLEVSRLSLLALFSLDRVISKLCIFYLQVMRWGRMS